MYFLFFRSRSRDRGRDRKRDDSREKITEEEREKDRERRKRGLPPIIRDKLSGMCILKIKRISYKLEKSVKLNACFCSLQYNTLGGTFVKTCTSRRIV